MTHPAHNPCRSRHTVLVTDADTLAGIACIRSLGRAGYHVLAASDHADALGLRSRQAHVRLERPAVTDEAFLPWLRNIIRAHDVGLIIPGQAVLCALRGTFEEFAPLLAYAPDRETIDCGLSKYDLFTRLQSSVDSAAHLPPIRLVEAHQAAPTATELCALGFPIFAKADAIHATAGAGDATLRLATLTEAVRRIAALRRRYRRFTLQGYVPGCGVGAFFLMHQGEPVAEFMHRRIHEVPHTGGVSALRASWRHDAIRADALAKLRSLRWEGAAMLEYRWDTSTDSFALVELNGRFWGSLHLALHAGVDFPALQADLHFRITPAKQQNWPVGVRCVHVFPRELQHVWSVWKDPQLSVLVKAARMLSCLWVALNPAVRSDLNFPGDRGLFWINFARQLHGAARRLLPRVRPAQPPPLTPRKAL